MEHDNVAYKYNSHWRLSARPWSLVAAFIDLWNFLYVVNLLILFILKRRLKIFLTNPNVYEAVNYFRYSGLACILVVVLGSVLSLIPGLKQRNKPNSDLLVPVMKVMAQNALDFLWYEDNCNEIRHWNIYFIFVCTRMFSAAICRIGQESLWRSFGVRNQSEFDWQSWLESSLIWAPLDWISLK